MMPKAMRIKRILMREVGRLNTSVELAKATDLEPIVFFALSANLWKR